MVTRDLGSPQVLTQPVAVIKGRRVSEWETR
jgi:hypothetical protein